MMNEEEVDLVVSTLDDMFTPFMEELPGFRQSENYELIVASVVSSMGITLIGGWAKDSTNSVEEYDLAVACLMDRVLASMANQFVLIKNKRGMH